MMAEAVPTKTPGIHDRAFLIAALLLGWFTSTVQGFRGMDGLLASLLGPLVGAGVALLARLVFGSRAKVIHIMFWTTLFFFAIHAAGRPMDWTGQPRPVRILAGQSLLALPDPLANRQHHLADDVAALERAVGIRGALQWKRGGHDRLHAAGFE